MPVAVVFRNVMTLFALIVASLVFVPVTFSLRNPQYWNHTSAQGLAVFDNLLNVYIWIPLTAFVFVIVLGMLASSRKPEEEY